MEFAIFLDGLSAECLFRLYTNMADAQFPIPKLRFQ